MKWNRHQLKLLQELFATNSNPAIAQKLHRTRSAVAVKASELGLKRTKEQVKALAIASFNEPGRRAKARETAKQILARADVRAKIGAAAALNWQKRDVRAKTIRNLRLTNRRPDVRARRSAASRASWHRPGARVRLMAALHNAEVKARRAASIRATLNKPAVKRRVRRAQRDWIQSPAGIVWKDTVSKRSKALWRTSSFRDAVTLGAPNRSPAARKHASRSAKRLWKDPTYKAKMLEGSLRPSVRNRLAHVRAEQGTNRSKFATAIRQAFGLPDQDIVLFDEAWDGAWPQYKVLLECHGCYWHGCRLCRRSGALSSAKRDAIKRREAVKAGWRVVYIWEHERTFVLADPAVWLRRNVNRE